MYPITKLITYCTKIVCINCLFFIKKNKPNTLDIIHLMYIFCANIVNVNETKRYLCKLL